MILKLNDRLIAKVKIWNPFTTSWIKEGKEIVIDDLSSLDFIPGLYENKWKKL